MCHSGFKDSWDEYFRDNLDTWKSRFLVPIILVCETILAFVLQAGSVLTSKAEQILKWLPESLERMCHLLTLQPHLKTFPFNSWCFNCLLPVLWILQALSHFRVFVIAVPSALHMDGVILSLRGTSYLLRKAFPYHLSNVTLQVTLAFCSIVLA